MSRLERFNEEMRHQVSLIVEQELSDPRIGFVTITRVEMTPDLMQARVYFTTLKTEKALADTIGGLNSATGFIRKLIGERIKTRFTPEIMFIYDDSQKKRDRIDEIIDKIHKEKENADEG